MTFFIVSSSILKFSIFYSISLNIVNINFKVYFTIQIFDAPLGLFLLSIVSADFHSDCLSPLVPNYYMDILYLKKFCRNNLRPRNLFSFSKLASFRFPGH